MQNGEKIACNIQNSDLYKIGEKYQEFEICKFSINNICIKYDSIVFLGYDKQIKFNYLSNNQNDNFIGHLNQIKMIKSSYNSKQQLSVNECNIIIFWQQINSTWKKQLQFVFESYFTQIIIIKQKDQIVLLYSDKIIISSLNNINAIIKTLCQFK
ncbi:unnamed protein product [Paramecium sonneborni]|uniref:Uncharacterized protein n=1 Tax=Paramecium sonneborni TaxID=65129 RepID=A0A8S1RSF9_9CILI|nr:unnamed protein product [Paramecium sonneborni]